MLLAGDVPPPPPDRADGNVADTIERPGQLDDAALVVAVGVVDNEELVAVIQRREIL